METLRSLAKLINDSIQQIDAGCTRMGTKFPSLEEPVVAAQEDVYNDLSIKRAAADIVGAAAQMIAAVQPANVSVMGYVHQVWSWLYV